MLVLIVAADFYVRSLAPRAKARIIAKLAGRFDADVQLRDLSLTLLPIPHVEGSGLSIRHRGWNANTSLISISRFSASTELSDLMFQRDEVDLIRLDGLQIDIPPKGRSAFGFGGPETGALSYDRSALTILIKTLVADNAVLRIEPKTTDKDPLVFRIQKLTMHSVGAGQPMTFQARLENAKPPGLIESSGSFGPWQKEQPRNTPLKGTYAFSRADLSVFSGISGTLSSSGQYEGILEHIRIEGDTDTPDFALKRRGDPVHLVTHFRSEVDATNGDTLLQPVVAHFLQSTFVCKGGVEKLHPHEGKTIDLDADATDARIEDILHLVVGHDRPMLTGKVHFQSKVLIPPGDQDVIDRLHLNGRFHIGSAIFTSAKTEHRLETLSDRGRGISKNEQEHRPQQTVASNIGGSFTLRDGVADFHGLTFQVPGAKVSVAGDYNLESKRIDMHGQFRMQATLSDTQDGWKHWLFKPFDPLFEKHGAGFEVPMTIAGTSSKPDVSVEALHHRFEVK